MAEKDDKDVHSHDSDVYSDLEQNSIQTLALLKTIIQWSELRLLQAKWVTYKAKWAKLVSKKEKQNRWEKKQIMSRPSPNTSQCLHNTSLWNVRTGVMQLSMSSPHTPGRG